MTARDIDVPQQLPARRWEQELLNRILEPNEKLESYREQLRDLK
jgi:hypothetical protein